MKLQSQQLERCAVRLFLALAVLLTLVVQGADAKPRKRRATAGQSLSVALFSYNSDDISDIAVKQFQTVITQFPGTQEAETAQYYLASYYQRKYYIQRERLRKEDPNLLRAAREQYFRYIDKYSTEGIGQWLTDAHFNIALADIQLQERDNAAIILERMLRAAGRDPKIYIYQIVWSVNPGDVVDAYMPAESLANYTFTLLKGGQTAEQVIPSLRRWCQGQKSLKA
ncbi:MAG: hypothetical protein DMF64_21790 [Acidobacteria bacterium]|nr:MAG: hypothetical protein DMF64_21790 [Acidobacteriota bacterium]